MSDYIKLTIPTNGDATLSDILVAELAEAGIESFDENPEGTLNAYIVKRDFNRAVFDKLFERHPFNGVLKYETEEIKSENWNNVWESNFEPVIIADKCAVYASFHKDLPETAHKILINPQMTFGTGHHETTYLCLEAILNRTINNKTVLDIGCGTGILGILAALKGAASVTAIDNDPVAAENAGENAALNKVDNKVKVIEGDVSAIQNRQFDLIVANINRNVLLNDMERYVKSLNKEGVLIISGFYKDDVPLLLNSATALGLEKVRESWRNGWTALEFNYEHDRL
jgi:ribosomal protein L11 methyltransferase